MRSLFIAAIMSSSIAHVAIAGPLSPPLGPVTSTHKTLTEVEPRTAINAVNTPQSPFALFEITRPGSYYLTQNIDVPAGNIWAIRITVPGVTVDLNGFTIDQAANLPGDIGGGISAGAAGITIRNGTIVNTFYSGISAGVFPTGAPGLTVENIRVLNANGPGVPVGGVLGSGTAGIFLGRGGTARNCYVNNAAIGIAAGYNATITGCVVEFARQYGINIEGGAQVSDCVVVGTAGGPTDGYAFVFGAGSLATGCVARSNSGAGFVTGDEGVLRNCSATNNDGAGFVVGNNATIDQCAGITNRNGGVLASGSTRWQVVRSSFSENTPAGILLNSPATHGRIRDNDIQGRSGFPAGESGIRIPAGCSDIAVMNNTIGFVSQAVTLDGNFCSVTNNSMQQSGGITTAAGGSPPANNLIGPVVTTGSINTATNPFSNIAR
jgi:hypothetical protein